MHKIKNCTYLLTYVSISFKIQKKKEYLTIWRASLDIKPLQNQMQDS